MAKPKVIPGGLLVIFEGLDGVGKTTQIQLAEEALKTQGYRAHVTRNLGGSPIGEELRKVLLSSLPRPPLVNLYVGVAIQEALAIEIEAKRKEGYIVLLDRGPISMAAYNSDVEGVNVWDYTKKGIDKFKPSLIVLYDLDIDRALGRVNTRGEIKNYFETKPRSYYEKVDSRLKEGIKLYKGVVVSADDPIKVVHERTMETIAKLL